LNITTLHVTHDFEEAIALGDRIAVIGEGAVKQIGAPEEIFRRPASEFVARFTMSRNIYKGFLFTSGDGAGRAFETDGITLSVADGAGNANRAAIRPEDVVLSFEALHQDNVFNGEIAEIADRGSTVFITVDLPPRISALVTRSEFRQMKLAVGVKIHLGFSASAVHVFKEADI